MKYEVGVVYHLYNHTNDYRIAFPTHQDYVRFIRKMRKELGPYGHILCYCIMPTHFHILFVVNEAGAGDTKHRRMRGAEEAGEGLAYQQGVSAAIRILLSSYTQGYNHKYDSRGSLFRARTKAKPCWTDDYSIRPWYDMNRPFVIRTSYQVNCFHYIHQNPVKAGFVKIATDWPYSSAMDYAGLRNGSLPNFTLAEELLDIERIKSVSS